jgi:hypothetical protein
MPVYRNFECRLSLPECDPDKLDDLRKQLRDLIDSDAFARVMTDLKVGAAHAGTGPKPKDTSGEFRVYGETSSRGETRVGASLSVRW